MIHSLLIGVERLMWVTVGIPLWVLSLGVWAIAWKRGR